MRYVILGLVMLSCFAFSGARPATSAPAAAPAPAAIAPDLGDEDAAGSTCGGRTCTKGTYCCNASCGICVPVGMSCTQQAC